MKKLNQTIIFFVAFNLITAGFVLAQNAPDEASGEEAVAAQKEAEIATKAAEKEAETARRQLEAAQKEVQAAEKQMQAQLKKLKAAQKQLEIKVPKIEVAVPHIPLLGHSHSGAVLVVPAAELKPEDLAAITEDMTVMSRIFDNKLSQARLSTARASLFVGFDPFSVHSSGTVEAVYLEDSPSPEAQEEKKTEEEDTDPLWKQMRQEIYAPEEAARSRTDDRPEEKYDAEKVEELKETLIKTLKHAVNIRALKPDHSVILTVIYGRSQSGTRVVTRSYRYGRDRRVVLTEPGAETATFPPTVLTICAKKSDIDAFAKGELSFDQFREKTRIFTSYAKVGNEGSPDLEGRTVAHEGHSVFIR
jgi:hypothetical protein